MVEMTEEEKIQEMLRRAREARMSAQPAPSAIAAPEELSDEQKLEKIRERLLSERAKVVAQAEEEKGQNKWRDAAAMILGGAKNFAAGAAGLPTTGYQEAEQVIQGRRKDIEDRTIGAYDKSQEDVQAEIGNLYKLGGGARSSKAPRTETRQVGREKVMYRESAYGLGDWTEIARGDMNDPGVQQRFDDAQASLKSRHEQNLGERSRQFEERQETALTSGQEAAVTKGVSNFTADTKTIQERLNQSQTVDTLLDSAADNPVAANGARIALARLAGEKGVLSDFDIKQWQGSQAIQDRIQQVFATALEGKLTEENRTWMIEVANKISESLNRTLRDRAWLHARRISQSKNKEGLTFITPEEVYQRIYPGEEPPTKASTTEKSSVTVIERRPAADGNGFLEKLSDGTIRRAK